MSTNVLMIATMPGVHHCAQTIAESLGICVDVASGRREGLLALRQSAYAVVIVEESLVEADPAWADLAWNAANLAIPLQVNFRISGASRLEREIRAALIRREGEHALARRAAALAIENDLKSSVTGLLLESELALREPHGSASLEPKLRHLVELAGTLRERLRTASHPAPQKSLQA